MSLSIRRIFKSSLPYDVRFSSPSSQLPEVPVERLVLISTGRERRRESGERGAGSSVHVLRLERTGMRKQRVLVLQVHSEVLRTVPYQVPGTVPGTIQVP